jgi:hypothetical protein
MSGQKTEEQRRKRRVRGAQRGRRAITSGGGENEHVRECGTGNEVERERDGGSEEGVRRGRERERRSREREREREEEEDGEVEGERRLAWTCGIRAERRNEEKARAI